MKDNNDFLILDNSIKSCEIIMHIHIFVRFEKEESVSFII